MRVRRGADCFFVLMSRVFVVGVLSDCSGVLLPLLVFVGFFASLLMKLSLKLTCGEELQEEANLGCIFTFGESFVDYSQCPS